MDGLKFGSGGLCCDEVELVTFQLQFPHGKRTSGDDFRQPALCK